MTSWPCAVALALVGLMILMDRSAGSEVATSWMVTVALLMAPRVTPVAFRSSTVNVSGNSARSSATIGMLTVFAAPVPLSQTRRELAGGR